MADEPNNLDPQHTTTPVVAPGLTFASVTDKISFDRPETEDADLVVRRFCDLVHPVSAAAADDHPTSFCRYRTLGHQHSGRLGNGHPQLRLVDRNRPRRHV